MRGFPTVVQNKILLNSQWPLSFQVFDFFFLFSDSQGSTLLVILLGRLDDNKGNFDGAHSLLSSLLWQKKNSSVTEQFTPFILVWHILQAFSLFTQESSSGRQEA